MKTIDDLKKAQGKLAGFIREQDAIIARMEAEVTRLYDAGARSGHPLYDKAWEKWDASKRLKGEYTRKFQGEVDAIQAELTARQAEADRLASVHAVQVEAQEKARARGAWIDNGGDPSQFEKQWPAIWSRVLSDRTAAAVESGRAEPAVQHVQF